MNESVVKNTFINVRRKGIGMYLRQSSLLTGKQLCAFSGYISLRVLAGRSESFYTPESILIRSVYV